jgi:excisionase family DNA binding protein
MPIPTPEAVLEKLRELGLAGRILLSVDETCEALNCSRSFLYDKLINTGQLTHIKLGEVAGGIEAPSVARLLLSRQERPLPVRSRGRRKTAA